MKLLKNIYIEILIIIYLSLALVFVEMRRHSIICKGLSVDIASIPAHFFINKADVAQIISDKGFKIKGTNIDKINILKIEKEITLNPSVETTEVHREINGILFVEVKQRNPIARIFNTHNESYYIDEKGAMMPISNKYSVRVLVANGAIKESYALNYTRNILKLQYNKQGLSKRRELNRGINFHSRVGIRRRNYIILLRTSQLFNSETRFFISVGRFIFAAIVPSPLL